jgi:hypothetical protein
LEDFVRNYLFFGILVGALTSASSGFSSASTQNPKRRTNDPYAWGRSLYSEKSTTSSSTAMSAAAAAVNDDEKDTPRVIGSAFAEPRTNAAGAAGAGAAAAAAVNDDEVDRSEEGRSAFRAPKVRIEEIIARQSHTYLFDHGYSFTTWQQRNAAANPLDNVAEIVAAVKNPENTILILTGMPAGIEWWKVQSLFSSFQSPSMPIAAYRGLIGMNPQTPSGTLFLIFAGTVELRDFNHINGIIPDQDGFWHRPNPLGWQTLPSMGIRQAVTISPAPPALQNRVRTCSGVVFASDEPATENFTTLH